VIGSALLGLFKKEKPRSVLDAYIAIVYGDPPPKKTAVPAEAAHLAHEVLLRKVVPKDEVVARTTELYAGPMPHTTHDLALAVALSFFKDPAMIPHLWEAQLMARLTAGEWLEQRKVVPMLAATFENILYDRYKPK
jgi:hypothetical protein